MTYDEVYEMLSELADELPEGFFKELNGGIALSAETKMQPESIAPNLYIMGEYSTDPFLGRHITIYYGSFERVYGHLAPEAYKKKLRGTLRHEFRHHLENMGRLRDLELEDERELARYKYENEERKAEAEKRRRERAEQMRAEGSAETSAENTEAKPLAGCEAKPGDGTEANFSEAPGELPPDASSDDLSDNSSDNSCS